MWSSSNQKGTGGVLNLENFSSHKQPLLSYLKQLSPTHRFGQVGETTIEKIHPSPSILNRDSIKILSWNIAKNNYDRHWREDFVTIIEQHQPEQIFLQEVRLCAAKQQIPTCAIKIITSQQFSFWRSRSETGDGEMEKGVFNSFKFCACSRFVCF